MIRSLLIAAGVAATLPVSAPAFGAEVAARQEVLTVRVVRGGALPLVVVSSAPMVEADAMAALDAALSRQERALPVRFALQPASLRPLILAVLRNQLLRPGANWDVRTGTAHHGSPYRALAPAVLEAARASVLGEAFARHGFRLETSGIVSGVEVGGTAGRRLPTEIADMGLIATRTR